LIALATNFVTQGFFWIWQLWHHDECIYNGAGVLDTR